MLNFQIASGSFSNVAWAFSMGSDARLLGVPVERNPFTGGSPLAEPWAAGWADVNFFWGSQVGRRWPVRPLPGMSG